MYRKNTLLIAFLFLMLGGYSFARSTENMTMTSYYPSPFGAYDRLTLYPRGTAPVPCNNATNLGMMFYDNSLSPHVFRICIDDGTGPHWDEIAVGASSIWTQTGNNIYPKDTASNPNLKIGIGTILPTNKFQVHNSSSDKDYFAVSTDGDSLGLDIRSPEIPGYPYIDFTNSNNVVNYDMRIQLDGDRNLDVLGGSLKVHGSSVCTAESGCNMLPHTHAADQITNGLFNGLYVVTGDLRPGTVPGNTIVANRAPATNAMGNTTVPFWFVNVDSANPSLCIERSGLCSTSVETCNYFYGRKYIGMYSTMADCTANCVTSLCDPAPLCNYSCSGESTGCRGGTTYAYAGPCREYITMCILLAGGEADCECEYRDNGGTYTEEIETPAGPVCTPFS